MSVAERQLMALLCSQWQHRGNAVQPPCFLDPGPKDQAAPRNHAELAQVLSKTVNGSFRTPVVLTSWTVLHFQVSKASSRLRILDPLWATRSWLREAALGSFGASCLQWWFSAARLWQSYLLCLCNGFSSLALSHLCCVHQDLCEFQAGQEPWEWGVSFFPGHWSCLCALCQTLGLRWWKAVPSLGVQGEGIPKVFKLISLLLIFSHINSACTCWINVL